MKILFLADNFAPEKNAQASRVYERACYWVKWGHEVTVITSAPNFPEGRVYPGHTNKWYQTEMLSGIRVVRVKTFMARNEGTLLRTLDFLSFMITAFLAGLFQPRPDVLAVTSPQFFAAIGACALAAVRGTPFVLEVSDLWPASIVAVGAMRNNFILRTLEALELFLYRRARAIVALTHAFKDDMARRGIDAQKISVVVNGAELSTYAPQRRAEHLVRSLRLENKFVVGYIGTLGMSHGLENVTAAAQSVQDIPVQFLFVGPGAERERLMERVTRLGIRNVTFVPPQPKKAIPAYWSVCDIALVHLKNAPLFQTVIPSKIFEAMAMGLPVLLVAPRGEASRIVLNERVGEWVPAGKPGELANAVRRLYGSPEYLAAFRASSIAAAPRFSRELQAERMLAVLESAIGSSCLGRSPGRSSARSHHSCTS